MGAPNWFWFAAAILVVLAILWLLGVRVNIG